MLRHRLCGLVTLGRHRPEMFAPVCGRCGAVVRLPLAERPVALYSPPDGTPVVDDPFLPPPIER